LTGLAATIFSAAMIAAFVLIGFGVKFAIAGPEHRKNGLLMITAGAVILGNVLVWTI